MRNTVCTFGEITPAQVASVGGKGGTLARLHQAGHPVPDGFVILPAAFSGEELLPEAWAQVAAHLGRMRRVDRGISFAVRSSALNEDSAQASFAGEFETVLDARTDEEIRQAILAVRGSRRSERVQAYSRAQGMDASHEVAVVVQRLIRADLAGVLFTADPVTGSHMTMTGNYVHGLGETLVSGEANPHTFTFKRPKGRYDGPRELRRSARKLYRLARRLESELGSPQDIEWAVSRGKLYLLQSRPITTLRGCNPATGEWNATLTGDFLWTNANFSEAVPDVMTPSTWSLWQIFYLEADPIAISHLYPLAGNICGRPYANLSLLVSLLRTVGINAQKALRTYEDALGRVPEGIDIPLLPLNFNSFLSMIPANLKWERRVKELRKELPSFVAASPGRCGELRRRIREIRAGDGLISLWREELKPYFLECCWMLRTGMKLFADPAARLRRDLIELAGTEDAHALLSKFSAGSETLASLGPVASLANVARGRMRREEYLERYGHRGPHECELAEPRPSEDQAWLDRQLAAFAKAPVDVETLLAKQRTEYEAAWRRFRDRHPRRKGSIERRIDRISAAARMREEVRSEFTRAFGVIRSFALRVGEMTGLGDDVFYLSLDEMIEMLAGDRTAAAFIPARRETHARYSSLPTYPAIINGRFDPVRWAADPDRRSDYYDAHAPAAQPASGAVTGFPGAAGLVEGLVRRLDRAEEGDRLQPGEILVTATTNVGWTPLFPRAAAIVTDVGAPLSHAAIVARELGIPAVVGCGDATMRLHTGDRVRVDGGRGTVEIL